MKLPFLRPRAPILPVIRLSGIIGGASMRRGLTIGALGETIKDAFEIKRAPAVALIINSPGGSPVQSSLIAKRIRQLAEQKKKPVIAFVEDIAASGGYWLALAADEILADRSSIIGSIGVVSAGFGFSEAIQKLGIERRMYTAGSRKAMLDPFRPESEDDVTLLKEIQGEIYAAFREEVRSRRGDKLDGSDDDLFSGRVWTGQTATELGLIDGLGNLHDEAQKRFGARVQIRLVNRPKSWLQRRFNLQKVLENTADTAIYRLEERLILNRYGL